MNAWPCRWLALAALGWAWVGPPAAARQAIEILSASDDQVAYRRLLPERVAVDAKAQQVHFEGCPAATADLPRWSPAAATLHGYRVHCPQLRRRTYETRTVERAPRDRGAIALLFLGNSLTYYNQMPAVTRELAQREARPLHVQAVTRSGVTLGQLWNDTEALETLWLRHWDFVVLQGGAAAAHPLHNAAEFERDLQRFASEARRSGATPLFYSVWRPGQGADFAAASRAAAARAGTVLVPAGEAWRDLVASGRFARLDVDGLHPSALGAYLVACTLYSTIYDKPATAPQLDLRRLASASELSDADLLQRELSADDARALQQAAWSAVRRHGGGSR